MTPARTPVDRLARIELTSADPERLAGFYAALGFTRIGAGDLPQEAAARLYGVSDARVRRVRLRLGGQRLDLVGFSPGGAPYPGDVPGRSALFQHFAMVASDMAAATARLRALAGWRPISQGGPQRLPEASGGVTAFKFRDPEGHPLEFLKFPEGKTPDPWRRDAAATDAILGIDHSAVSVARTERSLRFYADLGYAAAARSHNLGPEQARLDGAQAPDVAVTALRLPGQAAPHLELLCYRDAEAGPASPDAHDIAATRLVLEMEAGALAAFCAAHPAHRVADGPVTWPDGRVEALLRDPDGHQLLLTTDGDA